MTRGLESQCYVPYNWNFKIIFRRFQFISYQKREISLDFTICADIYKHIDILSIHCIGPKSEVNSITVAFLKFGICYAQLSDTHFYFGNQKV